MTPDLEGRLAGRRVVASVSGGKDSAAVSLWLTEQGIEHDRVFMDTGWEADQTYDYLRGDLPKVIGPIQWISAEKQMEDLILSKGMFASRTIRFCTEELKVFPLRAHLGGLIKGGAEVINTVGIRSAESDARSKMGEWEDWTWTEGDDTLEAQVWRSLLTWSLQDVIDIHARHDLRPNPLYLLGASRVGCWPCIFARKKEIELISRVDRSGSTASARSRRRWEDWRRPDGSVIGRHGWRVRHRSPGSWSRTRRSHQITSGGGGRRSGCSTARSRLPPGSSLRAKRRMGTTPRCRSMRP